MSDRSTPSPLRVALFEPRIPPNTGNIARTCAAFQLPLELIEPLGFSIDDRSLKRAGLDYWDHVQVRSHANLERMLEVLPAKRRLIGCSRWGGTTLNSMAFEAGDVLLFGREDTGLPAPVRERCDQIVTSPMPGSADERGQGGVRSLNLSVATALVTYVAGSQLNLW